MPSLATVVGVAIVAVLCVLVGRYVIPAVPPTHQNALTTAQNRVTQLDRECSELRARAVELVSENKTISDKNRAYSEELARLTERVSALSSQVAEHIRQNALLEAQRQTIAQEATAAGADAARLAERVASLTKSASDLQEQSSRIEAQRSQASEEAKSSAQEVSRLKEREAALTEKLQAQDTQLREQQQTLTAQFENIANKILRANASELSLSSQTELRAVIEPLRERIKQFEDRVNSTYSEENRQVLSLKEQINLMVQTSSAIGSQAEGLAKALRGDSQFLGRWGELALERILETAGLKEGREYVSQAKGMGLKSESGEAQRPDIIVRLPEARNIIIDSKVPLASYERLIAAPVEEKSWRSDEFVEDLKSHIDDLAGKRYQENEQLLAHDCVLLFVPIEGALAAALARDPELFAYAWGKRIVLVGPSTLLMTMQTVAFIWRYERQNQNTQEIARLAGELCDKVNASLADLGEVTQKLNDALSVHEGALKRLSTGKGNALSLGRRLQNLGVKTKKPMPSILIEGTPVNSPEGIEDEADVGSN